MDKLYISVGEPWNFTGPDGENRINGHIVKVISNKHLIFQANEIQTFKEGEGNMFLLTPRYTEDDFNQLQNEKYLVPANGMLIIGNYSEDLTLNQLAENSKFVIIGSIRTENYRSKRG